MTRISVKVIRWVKELCLESRSPGRSSLSKTRMGGVRRAVVFGSIFGGIVAAICWNSFDETFANRFTRPISFHLRSKLGLEPALSPRIRIYAFGDTTAAYLNEGEIRIEDWGKIFEHFSESGAKTIFVDKVFGLPSDISGAPKFIESTNSLKSRLIVGAFPSNEVISGRTPLSLGNENFEKNLEFAQAISSVKHIAGTSAKFKFLYGPHKDIQSVFPYVGHLYWSGKFFIDAFLNIGENVWVPSAPLLVADKVSGNGKHISLDSRRVSVDGKGRFIPNVADPNAYFSRTYALKSVIKRMRAGIKTKLPRDAVVVVLPKMYTGSTDFVESPFGLMPGGFVMVSAINSVLSGNWLAKTQHSSLFLFGAVIVGTIWGSLSGGITFYLGVLLFSLGTVLFGLVQFLYYGSEVPWLLSMVFFVGASAILFIERSRRIEAALQRVRDSLGGIVSENMLEQAIQSPSSLSLQPTGRIVSIMFVDIVGFSLTAESQSPKDAFFNLKSILSGLSKIVHGHGGIVDKSTGDGMLCFFGYSIDGTETEDSHADQALKCAIEMQRFMARINIEANKESRPVFPLRIGINTSAVYIGDLGATESIALTIIGSGVNFAKRLETACEHGLVMIGEATKESLINSDREKIVLRKRSIKIKHNPNLVIAYECDPLESDPELRDAATHASREYFEKRRTEPRFEVKPPARIAVRTNCGSGYIVNYSNAGFCLLLDQYVGVGVILRVTIGNEQENIYHNLKEKELQPLLGEVCWGRATPHGFIHGIQFRNMSSEQGSRLTRSISECIQECLQESQRKTA